MLRLIRRIHIDHWNAFISTNKAFLADNASLRYAIKDNISTSLENTTCASKILHDYKSPFDATVVGLLNQSGMTMVGKTNMDEFGMGSSTTYSDFGATINPKSTTEPLVSGGSLGGSAAAVAASLADFSLGTDTGGSVRQPAAYCDIYGFKPTYGRISRWGVVPYAQSLDTVGILARDASTVIKVFAILDQYDEKDPTSLPPLIRENLAPLSLPNRPLVIGVPNEFIVSELSPHVRGLWVSALENLVDMGHIVTSISLPSITKSVPAYFTLCTAEAASNLARYDGIRYDNKDREEDMVVTRSEELGSEVKHRIILGNYSLSSASGSHYLRAVQIRKQLVAEFNAVFNGKNHLTGNDEEGTCDFIISPTSISEAPTVKEYGMSVVEYVNDMYTVPGLLAGLPSISVPVGDSVGIQFMGQWGHDKSVLDLAAKLEGQLIRKTNG